jgi:very-short-patch-repair endonuclease
VHPDLQRLTDGQGGVFTREQALVTCSSAELRSYLRRNTCRSTDWRGIYADARCPDDVSLRARAASLWLGGDLVACHSTAAALWGFDLRSSETAAREGLHFLGPADLDNRKLGGLQVHPSSLGTADAVWRSGVWCTPADRTACDVARSAEPIDVLATLDAALRSGRCTHEELTTACALQRGLRGIVRVAQLVPYADGRAESPMESRMRWRFLVADLPVPDLQFEVIKGRRRYRLDLAWPEHKLAVEFDGLEAHMTREQLAADRDRHNWFTDEGWRLLHFTAVDVYRLHEAMVRSVARYL